MGSKKNNLTYNQVAIKIGPLMEELRRLDESIKRNKVDLQNATDREKGCEEGLAEAVARVKAVAASDVIDLAEYCDSRANMMTIEGYVDQAGALRRVLQNERDLLQAAWNNANLTYELLLAELMEKSNNVERIFQ